MSLSKTHIFLLSLIFFISCKSEQTTFFKNEIHSKFADNNKLRRTYFTFRQQRKVYNLERDYNIEGWLKFSLKSKNGVYYNIFWTEYDYLLEKVTKDTIVILSSYYMDGDLGLIVDTTSSLASPK